MTDLEYRIGGMKIEPKDLIKSKLGEEYKFIVDAINNVVSIYVAQTLAHRTVAVTFGVAKPKIVGGGSLVYNKIGKRLALWGYSLDYGAIPKSVAQKLAEIISLELKNSGIKINEIEADPDENKMNYFWKELGFG